MKRFSISLTLTLLQASLLFPTIANAQSVQAGGASLVPGGNAGNPAGTFTSEPQSFPQPRSQPTTPLITPGISPQLSTPSTSIPATSTPLTLTGDSASAGASGVDPTLLPTDTPPAGTFGVITLKADLQKTRQLPLSLENALKLALGENITIQIGQENETLQQADYLLRLSDLLPDITGEYRQSKFRGAVQVFGGDVNVVRRDTIQPQITANYSVYTGGRNIFDIRASKRRAVAQEHLTEETRQDIMRQVAVSYFDLQLAYWQRGISLQAINEAKAQVELTRGRYENGVGLELDILQSQNTLGLREQELISAEELIVQSSEHLGQLMNLDFEVDVIPDTLDSTVKRLIPENLGIKQMIDIARRNNPRLKALELLSAAGKIDVKTAYADLFPRVDLTAYGNRTGPTFDTLQPGRFVGVQASWDVLENMGTARVIEIRQAKANARIAEDNLRLSQRTLEETLGVSLASLKALEKRVAVATQSLEYSRQAYNQAQGRLREGVGLNIDLQLALTNLTQTRINLASAFLNYNRAQALLLVSLGVASPDTFVNGYHPLPKAP